MYGPSRLRKPLSTVASLLAVALIVSACSGGEAPQGVANEGGEGEGLILLGEQIADQELLDAARAEGSLTLYTSFTEPRLRPVIERFEQDTGVSVEYIRNSTAETYERVLSERGAGVLAADVVQIGDIGRALEFAAEEVWVPHQVPFYDEISDLHKVQDGTFYVSSQSVNAIAYNTALVTEDEAPTSWLDLADPKWKDQIALVHAGPGGTWARELYLRKEYGVEHWEAMAAQNPFLDSSHASHLELLINGEVAVAGMMPGLLGDPIEAGAPVMWVIPEEGPVLYNFYIGVVNGAPNENAAKLYLNWLLSLRGQEVLAEFSGDYSIRSGVSGPAVGSQRLPSRDEITVHEPELTDPDYIDRADEWRDEWFEIFGFQQ